MRIVLQRVNRASVKTGGKTVAKIGMGILLLAGIAPSDTAETACIAAEKISKLRIFADENGKTNLSCREVNAEVLAVPQFTLCADCTGGNRPSFINAAPPDIALSVYNNFLESLSRCFSTVKSGVFGADMKVSLENDGPFTLVLDF